MIRFNLSDFNTKNWTSADHQWFNVTKNMLEICEAASNAVSRLFNVTTKCADTIVLDDVKDPELVWMFTVVEDKVVDIPLPESNNNVSRWEW